MIKKRKNKKWFTAEVSIFFCFVYHFQYAYVKYLANHFYFLIYIIFYFYFLELGRDILFFFNFSSIGIILSFNTYRKSISDEERNHLLYNVFFNGFLNNTDIDIYQSSWQLLDQPVLPFLWSYLIFTLGHY